MRPDLTQILLVCVLATAARVAAAQPIPADEPFRSYEVHLGILAHDVGLAGGVEGGADLNLEVTSSTLVNPGWTANVPLWAQWVLHPRVHLGLEPNLNGRTSQAYAGLTWSAVLARDALRLGDAVEFSVLFGPSINDGDHFTRDPGRKSLGSNILFHVGGELSYRVTPNLAVGLYFDHSSNGGFARRNESINDLGPRFAYRF